MVFIPQAGTEGGGGVTGIRLARRRRLPVAVEPPAGHCGVRPYPAGMKAPRAHLGEGSLRGRTTRCRRYAYQEASSHLRCGLTLLQTLPDTPERAQQELDLQLALGPVLMATQGLAAPEVEQTCATGAAAVYAGW